MFAIERCQQRFYNKTTVVGPLFEIFANTECKRNEKLALTYSSR